MDAQPDPDFTLRHRGEILAIFERMQRERALTTITFSDGHAIVSSVLEVRRDANAVVLDVARDAEQNRRMFASRTLGFFTELDRVQITFETGAASPIAYVDGPAAVVEMPAELVRLQRREWFRAALPVRPPIHCTVLDPQGNTTSAQAIDLSGGGAALVTDTPGARDAQPGSEHELILSLPKLGRFEIDATLRTVEPFAATHDGSPARVRMGFRFESLPPRTAGQILRYVQQIEVNQLRILKRRGD